MALVIKRKWCDQIFDHGKVWEIREERCNKRGRFAIACSGTGALVGEARMVNCLRVGRIDQDTGALVPYSNTKEDCELFIGKPEHFPKHRINDLKEIQYSTVYAWVLDEAVRYTTPVPYVHPQGAIKWVDLVKQRPGFGDAQRQPRTMAGVLSTFETCLQPRSSSAAEVFGAGGILLLRVASKKCGVTVNNRCVELEMGDVLCLYASDEYFFWNADGRACATFWHCLVHGV